MHTAEDYQRELERLGWSATDKEHPESGGGGWSVTATRGGEQVTGASLTQIGAWRMALEQAQRK